MFRLQGSLREISSLASSGLQTIPLSLYTARTLVLSGKRLKSDYVEIKHNHADTSFSI